MARAEETDIIDQFEEFYRTYYRNEIGELARKYPNEQRSLYVSWDDLYRFDQSLAESVRKQPDQYRDYLEEALRLYDLPVDVSLGQAHVRVYDLPETTEIREIRAHHYGQLVSVRGIIRKATNVRPKIQHAAFECQRCGTLTRVPQEGGEFVEPHECQGCERQGPFRINFDQSEFVDAQKLRVQESPEGLRGGERPQNIDFNIEDDITGEVTAGDTVLVTGVIRLDQQGSNGEQSTMFDIYMDGVTLEVEDDRFEDMDITEEDKKKIIALSEEEDIYDKMITSMAPSIYGYDHEKLAIILQLFSGVTKHLPDGTRIRGDMHILLIGDPGTGKCVSGDTTVALTDSESSIRELVESNLTDPKPVDDGYYDEVEIELPTMKPDGSIEGGQATKVWKREAPDQMYRIYTESGKAVTVTPSHPLFVQSVGTITPTKAENLAEDQLVAIRGDENDSAFNDVRGTRALVQEKCAEVSWERIESIETVDTEDEWVYDLEVERTHTYLTNGIVSHNSQLLQYIRNIAPRSVYTSGKGSSAAGLCVTGDTRIHTQDGFRPIREIAREEHPDTVERESAAPYSTEVYTYDDGAGEIEPRETSHVWRMPEKQCRRIETATGKELEASQNTTVLTCGDQGLQWKPIAKIDQGDHVAVPKYDDIERTTPSIREYIEYTNEKVKLTTKSVEFVRKKLRDQFGTLRSAAAKLGLSEDFIYDSLRNRFIPIEKLSVLLDAISTSRDEVTIERAMLQHGEDIQLPTELNADIMYLLGLVFGDGDISVSRRGNNRGLIRLSNSDESILRRAIDIIETTFDKRVEIEYQEQRVPCIRVSSATIARLFSNMGMRIPKDDLKLDPQLTTAENADAFLRGLFDADGSVSARTNGGSSIQFSTISDELAAQVQFMLETYGIRSRHRKRDRRAEYTLRNGQTIETKKIQTHLAVYGRDIDTYATEIGFESTSKQTALSRIVADTKRADEKLPIGAALQSVDINGGEYYMNISRGDNPGRSRASAMLTDLDLGTVTHIVEEAVEANLCWEKVVAATDTGKKELYDLTVPETHNFIANGIVTHNTAAAVRDDFGEGQQWSLEAGALVLADQGVAAVDELDKMDSSDRSALHEGLEQQEISVSKAGINATLKSRCSLLGAANPKYGRFNEYEPIGEQIDLEPALISRFDIIFTVTDKPDEEEDKRLAEHIVGTNYAGELHTHRTENSTSNVTSEEVESVTADVEPEINADLLRKYIAYAKRSCFPMMTEDAKQAIEEFYVDLRSQGTENDAPVPVTARKLEAFVRLAEASARLRLSDTVEQEDVDRILEIVTASLEDIGMDPETGEFDADMIETGTSKSQRDRIRNIKGIISEIEADYENGAPIEEVLERAASIGMDRSKAEHEIEKLGRQGDVYKPDTDSVRTV